ncbi:MAG: pyrroloquinoline quinone biosynthesis peptide chaperone PqqD [Chthoniobacter sp.]|nr:pyrroloquinoline quinone biosynthesis peptide chaperone PqqD [Chthoniobacter sp.]
MRAIELHARPALAPGVRLQTDRVTGEPVLLSPEGIHVLNETAHAIVVRCDGKRTIEEVTAALAEEYDAPVEALREDVLACLAELHETGRIVIS